MLGWWPPMILWTAVTAAAPAAPMAWLLLRRDQSLGRTEATLLGLAQVGVLAVNAISRQVVQNLELKPVFDASAQATSPQWGPMIVFLLLFVAGLAVVAWMLLQVIRVEKAPPAEEAVRP